MKKLPINMRVLPEQKALTSQAAEILKMDRNTFILSAVCSEAEEVILNQRVFLMDDEAFHQFKKTLEKPSQNNKLKKLLLEKSPWE